MELPAVDEMPAETPERIVRTDDDLTCEIWSGTDKRLWEFLEAGLKENGIASRVERQGEKATIYASRVDEAAACDIVREIVEGVPPE